MKFIKKQIIKESVEETVTEDVVEEQVSTDRTYERTGIEQAIDKVLQPDDDLFDRIQTVIMNYGNNSSEELTAEEVDKLLDIIVEGLELSEEQRNQIESVIINDTLYNPAEDRKSDFESDLSTLRYLLEDDKLYSPIIKKKLSNLIDELSEMNYTGLNK